MADAPTPEIPALPEDYVVPPVWKWDQPSGGAFASINRPIAGATHDKELPVGRHPLQLYSLGTPNGQKVTIMLEELLALGHRGAEYDAWPIRIGEGEQPFGLGDVLLRLDGDAAVEAGVMEQRREISRQEIAAKRGHRVVDPGVRFGGIAPEVLVGVYSHLRLRDRRATGGARRVARFD